MFKAFDANQPYVTFAAAHCTQSFFALLVHLLRGPSRDFVPSFFSRLAVLWARQDLGSVSLTVWSDHRIYSHFVGFELDLRDWSFGFGCSTCCIYWFLVRILQIKVFVYFLTR